MSTTATILWSQGWSLFAGLTVCTLKNYEVAARKYVDEIDP